MKMVFAAVAVLALTSLVFVGMIVAMGYLMRAVGL